MAFQKVYEAYRDEVAPFNPTSALAELVTGFIPPYVGGRLRTRLLRLFGFNIGKGTVIWQTPHMTGTGKLSRRLVIGEHVSINIGCLIELNDRVSIGDHAALGHRVTILTATHKLGHADRRCGDLFTAPVSIGPGAWIGAGCILLPGVEVGAGSVIAAGSVVNKNVPPNSLVAGVPAQIVVPKLPT